MRKIRLFMNVSLDGYVADAHGDISWAQGDEAEFQAHSRERGGEVDIILLGHTTYRMMESYWPTPQAAAATPEFAAFMNEKRKVVASHAPFEPGWSNVTVISGDVAAAIRQLKAEDGNEIVVFGSNTLSATLLREGLLDELQIVVCPVALGAGISLFAGLPTRERLVLSESRAFPSGKMFLAYTRAAR